MTRFYYLQNAFEQQLLQAPFIFSKTRKALSAFSQTQGGGKLHPQERQELLLFLTVLRRHHRSKSDNRYQKQTLFFPKDYSVQCYCNIFNQNHGLGMLIADCSLLTIILQFVPFLACIYESFKIILQFLNRIPPDLLQNTTIHGSKSETHLQQDSLL